MIDPVGLEWKQNHETASRPPPQGEAKTSGFPDTGAPHRQGPSPT